MAQHTPGPWHAYPADYQGGPADLHPIFVVGPSEFHTVAQVRAGNEDDDLPAQTAANARLIAAAPDLLDALKYARWFLNEKRSNTALVDAAIAKATAL